MNGVQVAKYAVETARQFMEGTVADVSAETANTPIPGLAHPVGASYAHALIVEDMVIAGMLQGGAPLFATSWAGKNGVSEPMPMPGPDWVNYGAWADTVKVDIQSLREYAQAVYGQTDSYLAGLSDGDLDRDVDLTAFGFGVVNVGWILTALLSAHTSMLHGEIAAGKGVLGLKGYPF